MDKSDYSVITERLLDEVKKSLKVILAEGFGRIEIIIDSEREIFDVLATPRKRIDARDD